MSAESTEAAFAALVLANIPPKNWSAQAFTDHTVETTPLSVTGYDHSIDANGVVTLTFTVNHNKTSAKFAGKFKKGTVNEVDRDGVLQAKPTFDSPVDAGTGNFNADNIKTQIWYRYKETPNILREFRFETSINFPKPLPII